jgi:hypothetical protein
MPFSVTSASTAIVKVIKIKIKEIFFNLFMIGKWAINQYK